MKSILEISAGGLRSNLAAIRASSGAFFEPLCVLKANAYGHSATLCAPVLVASGASWLGVGDLEEGIRVRRALHAAELSDCGTRILVMCGFEAADAPGLVEHGLTPVLWTPEQVGALETAAARTGVRVPVHLEVDTGMARQGVAAGLAFERLLNALDAAHHLRVDGVFSHLSSSEVAGSAETALQLERFHRSLAILLDRQLLPQYLHLSNSSAVDEASTLPWLCSATASFGAQLLVRTGLALYGYALPLEGQAEARLHPKLLPVATWKTRILDVREVAPGTTVGYGASFRAKKRMRLALLPVGYADGFRREASSGVGDGWVQIAGRRAPVVGRVSMNLTVVDVTEHTPSPAIGDTVLLMGEGVTAEDHARWCGTIAYEILCGMRGPHQLSA